MHKVNVNEINEKPWGPSDGAFAGFSGFGKGISEGLGRDPSSLDLRARHPFDLEIQRIEPGKAGYPYHTHSEQWELYFVVSGSATVRHRDGTTTVIAGDAFIFQPGEPHQTTNDGTEDLVLYCIADNPIGEYVHLPDTGKWIVRLPERTILVAET